MEKLSALDYRIHPYFGGNSRLAPHCLGAYPQGSLRADAEPLPEKLDRDDEATNSSCSKTGL